MRGLLAIMMLSIAFPVMAQETVLRIATVAPDGSSWMREMRKGSQEIERRTEGRVRIQYFPGGVMGNEQTVLRRIRISQLHGGAFTSGALSSIHPDSMLYTLPFLFSSYEEVDHVRASMDADIEAGLERSGLVGIGIAEGGFAMLMSSRPITSVEDLRARRVWVPEGDEVAYAAIRAFGLSPATLPLTDVLTALQTGLVDTVVTPPIAAIAFQWHTRVGYFTDFPLAYTYAQLVVDRRALQRLRAQDREVFESVMRATYKTLDAMNREENRRAVEALQRQGLERVVLSQAESVRWVRIAERVNRELVEDGGIDPEIARRMFGVLEDYRSNGAPGSGD